MQSIALDERKLSKEEFTKLNVEIQQLLEKGAIEECKECEGQFLSSFFLVPKADGSNRFIFNLKNLNKFIKPPHFKLEDMRAAVNLLSPGYFMGTIDLKDAYFAVPIFEDHKKFLRFKFTLWAMHQSIRLYKDNEAYCIFIEIVRNVINIIFRRFFVYRKITEFM